MSPSMVNKTRFLLDENIDIRLASFLKSLGHSVASVPKGISDKKVVMLAEDLRAILITLDTDFTNVTLFPSSKQFGIVVLRIHPPKLQQLIDAMSRLFTIMKLSQLYGKLWIVNEFGVEILKLGK